jgi:hypothetical protein
LWGKETTDKWASVMLTTHPADFSHSSLAETRRSAASLRLASSPRAAPSAPGTARAAPAPAPALSPTLAAVPPSSAPRAPPASATRAPPPHLRRRARFLVELAPVLVAHLAPALGALDRHLNHVPSAVLLPEPAQVVEEGVPGHFSRPTRFPSFPSSPSVSSLFRFGFSAVLVPSGGFPARHQFRFIT